MLRRLRTLREPLISGAPVFLSRFSLNTFSYSPSCFFYLDNPHPGIILEEEFLQPLGLSQNGLAQAIGVLANRINEIVRGRRGITADTDLRLARFFKLSEGYWLRLQNTFDMMQAHRELGKAISQIKPFEAQDRAYA